MNEYVIFDANGLTLPPLSETEAWFQALEPVSELTLVAHYVGTDCWHGTTNETHTRAGGSDSGRGLFARGR